MSKSTIFTVMSIIVLILAACAPAAVSPTPILTEEPAIPVTGVAVVESVEIQILESMPVQINAIVRGYLPDAGCTTIASVNQVRDGNTITITLVTTTDPLALCAQALTPFEQVVPLDVSNLAAGEYTVNANGIVESFELPGRDAGSFQQMLVDALNVRDYELLKSLMGDPFMIGYWQSEGTTNTPEQAIEQLQRNLLISSAPVIADTDEDLAALLGMDPVTIPSPEVVEATPLLTTGWGPEGKDEAILFLAQGPDGNLYWYGMLFAKDGFAGIAPIVGAPIVTPPSAGPVAQPEEIPTYTVLAVEEDALVTIQTLNFPASTKFKVLMGTAGTLGVDGILVETINSQNGGSFTATFEIPARLHGAGQISLRLESDNGYYSYNWFDNKTFALADSDLLPTSIKYVMAHQDVSIHNGPAKKYRIVGSIPEGQIVRVTGISVDGKWWRVVCPGNPAESCWVLAKPAYTRPVDSPL
jgi:hypothetical protein